MKRLNCEVSDKLDHKLEQESLNPNREIDKAPKAYIFKGGGGPEIELM